MDLERIERALRAGPVDEPTYVAGAFRRAGRLRSTMLMTAAVGAALVLGIVVGMSLDTLRSPSGDTGAPGPDLEALNAELEGLWLSDIIHRHRFVDFMVARGHAEADVDAFLDRGGVGTSTRFHLGFDGRGRLTVYETTETTDILSDEPYELLPDGGLRLMWGDAGCVVTARFTIADTPFTAAGARLTFEAVSTTGCDADERIAADAFFNFKAYTFDPGSPY